MSSRKKNQGRKSTTRATTARAGYVTISVRTYESPPTTIVIPVRQYPDTTDGRADRPSRSIRVRR
jgi:hypothetical protein